MNNNSKEQQNGTRENFWTKIVKSLKEGMSLIILSVVAFVIAGVICFFGVTKNVTVAAFSLNEYEVGQIADRTIIAEKELPATTDYPIEVKEGEKIIKKGFPISMESYQKLEKMANTKEYIDYRSYVDNMLYLFLLIILWFFLFSPLLMNRRVSFKELLMQIIFFLIIYSITIFAGKVPFFARSAYHLSVAIPHVLCIILLVLLFGERSAVFFSIILSLGVLNASDYNLVVFVYTLGSSLAATRILRKIETRIQMVFASLLIAVLNVVLIVVFKVIFNDPFGNIGYLLMAIAANGFLCGIFALGLITPLEQIMNTASVFRLIDLSDLNNPTMRSLLLNASGTYSHAMMVATLAENACKAIGANSLVARVGAYYHDIGKMEQSEYFVENQSNGQNKHDELNPNLSVSVIRSHVKRGVEKAHQMHLPPQIIDIIAEHHGNSVIAYFYNEALKTNPDASAEDYSYSGNPPTTKESAVVMLADTVEAACRTLEKPSVYRLEKFIASLIESKIQHGQLANSPLTFKDITTIKESFVAILTGYYHSRIEYPDQKDPEAEKNDSEKKEAAVKKGPVKSTGTKTVAKKAPEKTAAKTPSKKTAAKEGKKNG
ncbi:MAG: HDIG domain-containing protein [Treponema sp.]|nr:HDIG domain-containing protein [Treponema sp.]